MKNTLGIDVVESCPHCGRPNAVAESGGALLAASLIGGVMASGDRERDKLVFCEDCEEWIASSRLCCSLMAHHAPDPKDGSWGPLASPPNGPLWPGCRGFKLREGAPGPDKRYAEKVKADTAKLHEEMKRRRTGP